MKNPHDMYYHYGDAARALASLRHWMQQMEWPDYSHRFALNLRTNYLTDEERDPTMSLQLTEQLFRIDETDEGVEFVLVSRSETRVADYGKITRVNWRMMCFDIATFAYITFHLPDTYNESEWQHWLEENPKVKALIGQVKCGRVMRDAAKAEQIKRSGKRPTTIYELAASEKPRLNDEPENEKYWLFRRFVFEATGIWEHEPVYGPEDFEQKYLTE